VKRSPFERALRSALSPLYRRLETSVHPLRYLFLEITSLCDLACLHCGSDCGRARRLGEMSTAEWVALVEELPRRFPDPRPFVVITGGEPLCHPELPLILAAVRRGGLRCGLVTNGWLLDERRLAVLLGLGVESVTVSLDGMAESHDWLRGRGGSFDRALLGIRLLAASRVRIFDVVTCVNPRNLRELPRVEELLKEAGATRWRLFSIFPKGRARGRPELLLSAPQLRELLAWIAERRRANSGEPFAIDFCCEGYLPRDVDRRVRDEPYFCRAGISIGSVLVDGTISACPNISRALAQGNVRVDDLRSVWDGRFAKYRDRAWMRKGPCAACVEWRRCLGNSMHLWDEESGHTCLCHRAAVRDGGEFLDR
jgi:radical SAM protein with 4Fe4S-binding SPASM domain